MLRKVYESCGELLRSVLEKMPNSLIFYPIKHPLLFPRLKQSNSTLIQYLIKWHVDD